MASLPGFTDLNEDNVNQGNVIECKYKPLKKSGGFQSMGLNYNILKGITKRGYKVPTPIQRKTIPIVLEKRDVVAMARTGSGKTACFLIPLFEILKIRSAKAGARALILSPTRELALQTLKFIKELGRYTGLKAAVILGGDSMDNQFSAIHGNPDIIVATPGRFLHVIVEMDLKLHGIEYIVFDEADRLFEMGFGEQLNEIVNRLPDTRQTLLFSATLPKILVDFAKAGLNDPVLVRLDVESKLPSELQLWFIPIRSEERLAALLFLLKNHIDCEQQTVVFAATKHHVEYLHSILDHVGISNTYIYSNLDPSARKINAAKFNQGKASVLVVTDVAARGIDIPQLDNVINYNFPAKSKLFIHRVGRCARAGRFGTAYSLVGPDEYAHLLDLHLFLGKSLSIVTTCSPDGAIGRIPQTMLEEQHEILLNMHDTHLDLLSLKEVSEKGYLQYIRSRPAAAADSCKRAKDIEFSSCGIHSMFKNNIKQQESEREDILGKMRQYRPHGTIFEICAKTKSEDYVAMKNKRAFHKEHIAAHHKRAEEKVQDSSASLTCQNLLPPSNNSDIANVFKDIVLPKKRKIDDLYKKKNKKIKDEAHYIPYLPSDKHTEEGLAVNNFNQDASKVQFDMTGDSEETMKLSKQVKKWDRKKKKMITVNLGSKEGKIKTESGVWIPATYKSNRYSQWKEKTKAAENAENSDEEDGNNKTPTDFLQGRPNTHWARHNEKMKLKQRRSELKTNEQILKQRLIAEKKKRKQKGKKKFNKRRK